MEKLFTLIKKTGLNKEHIEQLHKFTEQVQENAKIVVQYIEPKFESGISIIKEESSKIFDEILKDLKWPESQKENTDDESLIKEIFFQDFLEKNGVTKERYKALWENWGYETVREMTEDQPYTQWLLISFNWSLTDEGYSFWDNLHKRWTKTVISAEKKVL